MTSSVNDTQSVLDGLGLSRKTNSKQNSNELGSDAFMELMLAQMQHQDPLNPTDSAEYLSQIAQFSTVTGIDELKDAFGAFAGSMQSNQALQASSMVGRTVLVPSSTVGHTSGADVSGMTFLPASASNVKLGIYDSAGQLVRTVNLGEHAAGDIEFSWDGKTDAGTDAPAGTYTIKAEAFLGEESTALETFVYDQVQSVDLGYGKGLRLNLADLGAVDFSDVIQVK